MNIQHFSLTLSSIIIILATRPPSPNVTEICCLPPPSLPPPSLLLQSPARRSGGAAAMEWNQRHCQQSTTERCVCLFWVSESYPLLWSTKMCYFFNLKSLTPHLWLKYIVISGQMHPKWCTGVTLSVFIMLAFIHWSPQLLQSLNQRPVMHLSRAGTRQTAQTPTRLKTDTGERCLKSLGQKLTLYNMSDVFKLWPKSVLL